MTAPTVDHTETIDVLAGLCRGIALLPLKEARATIERAHTLGPILDPTAYQAGMGNLQDQADLLDAALALQAVVHRIGDRAMT